MEATIFNLQRYSIDDGPGVRTTVFFKGCPLTCLWCSNPESQSPAPEISYRYTSCKRCGTCVTACPEKAITLGDDGICIDRAACTVCGKCVDVCVPEALSVSGKPMTVDEVMKTVRRDFDYYEASGGGVTASGGEILMQADFVAELFRRCREENIGTCADTSGFGTRQALEKVLEYSDLVLFDIKHMDDTEHTRACGQSNALILDNLRLAVEKGVQVIIRVPLIPDFNTSEESLTAMAKAVADVAPGVMVNIMPYHRYGANKYRMLDKSYALDELRELTEDEKERAKTIMESHGLSCEVSK